MIYSNRALKRLLVPLVIEQVLVMLVGMVDTVMVASAGEAAVSGVALVDMVNYLIITVMAAKRRASTRAVRTGVVIL